MNDRRLTLDTNILFYAVDKNADSRHDLAMEIVDRASVSDCVIVLQCLCEFFAAVTAKGAMPAEEAEAQIKDWMELFPVASASPKSLTRALAAVRKHRLFFWDAMGWAVACEARVTLLLSEDFQHDRVLNGTTFWNPFRLTNPLDEIFSGIAG